MANENWSQIKEIFDAALRRNPEERSQFLDEACDGNLTIRREVESLLSSFGRADRFMDKPVFEGSNEAEKIIAETARKGQSLGRYEVVSFLGKGGMGEVYLAKDSSLDRMAAVKVFPHDLAANGILLERFIREAQAASALNHPNICTIYEINKDHEPPFIAMEFIEGRTLAEIVRDGKNGIEAVIEIALQVAKGLKEIHDAGLVHRDIKPANIIVNKRGEAKILDFGLAKKLTTADLEGKTQEQLSVSGMIMGTVGYMSPEQVKGETIDQRSDIFSFGVLLYEMASHRRPFDGDSVAETISLILTAEPRSLQVGSIAFEAVVRKCLDKDPERRFQTMDDLSAALERAKSESVIGNAVVQADEQETVRMEPLTTQDTSSPPRRFGWRWGIAFAILTFIAVAASYAFYFRGSTTPQNLGSNPSRSPAYDLYVRGKVKVLSVNDDDNRAAINMLEQAVAIDPNYAEAWAELAKGYTFRSFNFAPDSEKRKLNEDAEVAVEKALALNPDLAEGHLARGLVLWTHTKRFPHEQAIQAFKRAIALKPDLDEAHQWLSAVYIHIGLFDEATKEINKTLEINPNNTTVRLRMIAVNTYQGKYEDAIAVFKTTPPDMYPANLNRITADALVHLGRLKEADAIVEEYLKTYPQDEGGNVTSVKAILLAKADKQKEAEAAIQRASEIGQGFGHFHHTAYNIASAYAIMKNPDAALQWLQNAADDGFPCYRYFESDHNLDNIRDDRRFIAFMSKLKEQWLKYKAEYDQ